MTDYKLVPVEPTPEMVEAGKKEADWYEHNAIYCYQAMLAAAPSVQGEPLGYVVPRMAARLGKGELCGISVLDQPEDGHTLPVYLTPQPAEEAREVVVTKDKLGNIVSVTLQDEDHRILEVIAEAAEQQPAPDVPGLTEALRQYQHNDGSGLVFGYDKLLVDQCVTQLVEALMACAKASSAAEVGLIVDDALAAHRKQGGES